MAPPRILPKAALHCYLTAHHEIPNQPASVFYATTVTTHELTPTELAMQVAGKHPEPIQSAWYKGLTYPVIPEGVDPRLGLDYVQNLYAKCAGCHLSESRTHVVFFRGNPGSPVVLMGEGPGKTEDAHGLPFVGRSGKLEDRILEACSIPPTSLGWINLMGCRPCDNRFAPDRSPSIVEKAACSERTLLLLQVLRPSVIVCLGLQATHLFFDDPPPEWTWRTAGNVVVGHARHPAYLLRRLGVQGGEAERVAAMRFYRELADRLPKLQKLPRWTLPINFLREFGDGRIATH